MKQAHLLYCPFTGLGLYRGYRGSRWLRNRIKVFKNFVLPSLKNQTNQDFILWLSWRPEDQDNRIIREFHGYLSKLEWLKFFPTFGGVCFWDDKYPDDLASDRLSTNLNRSLMEAVNYIGDASEVLMTIQPSDDCYIGSAVQVFKDVFRNLPEAQAVGFTKGYICNYATKEISEYNPKTNPPFFTIRFRRETFLDPLKHMKYTGPYKSHEYVGNFLRMVRIETRGFVVGTHGENISTYYDHPFKGVTVEPEKLALFGIQDSEPLVLHLGIRRWILRKLPHPVRRKIRYWFGELLWHRIYEFLRS